MIEDTPSRRRAVSPPVLILEDDMIRARVAEMLGIVLTDEPGTTLKSS